MIVTRRERNRLSASRLRGLPGAVVLLQISTAAGLSPRSAISVVGELSIVEAELGVVARDFADVSRRLELGADLSEVILALDPDTTSPSMSRVLDVLRRAEIDGVALAMHLEMVLRDLRRERALALDTSAQRLTVSLLFPLVVCILPAFVLLAVVPLLLSAFSNLPG